jgi:ADP-heptose:LPS heptosyltransferase
MRILVIRTSAMGDVALTTPVLTALTNQYPDYEVFMVTRKQFEPFFSNLKGVNLIFTDLRGKHRGVTGLFRLFSDLNAGKSPDLFIDLHDVLRTKIIRLLFRIKGIPVFVIDKGRKGKRELVSGRKRTWLKHSVERYADVFRKAGITIEPVWGKTLFTSSEALKKASEITAGEGLAIGVAPGARHPLKRWPAGYMEKLLSLIAGKYNAKFFLFGGADEKEELDLLSGKVKGCVNLSGNLSLEEELAIMERLDFMLTMDSSNMHMAALSGTSVISVWGGTDPMAGFGAWMQPEEYSIRIPAEELTCRPCTVYGKGNCRRGDLACMMWLEPEIVLSRIEKTGLLGKQ